MKIFSKPISYGRGGKTDVAVDEMLNQVKELMCINSTLQHLCRGETKKQIEVCRKQAAMLKNRRVMLGESIKAALDIQ